MKNKLISLFLVVCIMMTLFTACAANSSNKSSTSFDSNNESISLQKISKKSSSKSSSKKGKLKGAYIGLDPGHQAHSNKKKEANAPGSSVKKAKVSSGTSGRYSKVREHEVNLKVALLLKDLLEKEGAKVLMTRTTADVDISNVERAKMMNKAAVDFVLRIHCDGNDDSSVNGASMLVPSGKYVTDIKDESYVLGETIYKRFIKSTGAKDRGVKKRDDQTGFNWSTVLVCTIEMGFMSNKKEDKKLVSDEYQKTCAQALCDGIIDYVSEKE